MRYFRVRIGSDDPRLVARDGRTAYDLSSARPALSSFRDLAMVASTTDRGVDDVAEALLDDAPVAGEDDVESGAVRPVVPDEVWAAGVTYEVSGDAREDESGRPEMYQDVFENDRPELFFKATPSRTVGPDDRIGVREDSEWDVPEPELGIVLYEGDVVGYKKDENGVTVISRLDRAGLMSVASATGGEFLHEPRGVAMGKVVAPDHVHGRGMHPSQSSYLHNHPTGPGGPVDHPLPG